MLSLTINYRKFFHNPEYVYFLLFLLCHYLLVLCGKISNLWNVFTYSAYLTRHHREIHLYNGNSEGCYNIDVQNVLTFPSWWSVFQSVSPAQDQHSLQYSPTTEYLHWQHISQWHQGSPSVPVVQSSVLSLLSWSTWHPEAVDRSSVAISRRSLELWHSQWTFCHWEGSHCSTWQSGQSRWAERERPGPLLSEWKAGIKEKNINKT